MAKSCEETVTPDNELAETAAVIFNFGKAVSIEGIKTLLWQHVHMQAKLTWPEAYKAGMREVVEQIGELSFIPKAHNFEYYVNEIGQQEKKHQTPCKFCEWQNFLKEKGIDA